MDAKLSHKSTRALPLCMASANATKLHSTVVDAQFPECMPLKVVSTMVETLLNHEEPKGNP